jgi:glycosyltransferase involved in cell wall biosynthesis
MRILFITPRFPYPADRGDRHFVQRTTGILATRHDVTVIALTEGAPPPGGVAALEAHGMRVHTVALPAWRSWLQTALALFTGAPLQIAYYHSPALTRLVRELGGREGFDVVFGHLARVGPYVLAARADLRIGLLSDAMGMSLRRRAEHEHVLARPLVLLEARRMEAFEWDLASRLDAVWTVSPVDRGQYPAALLPRIRVVPCGIPRSFLQLDRAHVVPRRMVFVGHMTVPHNVDAASHLVLGVLPRVRETFADATVHLTGAGDNARMRALGALAGVERAGFVEDLGAEYASAEAFVAPLRFASGMQNKLVEAMAAGVPCVTSAIAAEGIGALPDDHLLVAESDDEFAACVRALFADPARARQLGERGRRFVAERFDWAQVLAALDTEWSARRSGAPSPDP